MGGEGTPSPRSKGPLVPFREAVPLPPDPLEEGYVVINRNSDRGGKQYPFIEQLGREWSIVVHPVDEEIAIDPQYTLQMSEPTLRWINGGNYVDVYIDGLSQEQFEQLTGLEFSTDKGGFMASKRVSRALREYYLSNTFPAWNLDITTITDETDKLIMDGGGIVSRKLLKRMPLPQDLDPVRRAELLYQRDHANRVEFTIMTKDGQYKGHAIVSDAIEEDFILPHDCKTQAWLNGNDVWVGFDFVHGHTDMRIDVQSAVNLHPFFDVDDYHQWLRDEYNLFEQTVREGRLLEAVQRIQPDTTLSDLEHWPLAQYACAGGQADWSTTHTQAVFNQMIERVRTQDEKMRLPIPGGRMYIMTEKVARLAGLDVSVARGKTVIDPAYQTVWVNDQDWLSLSRQPGSGDGIRDILGGADHDDGIWCFPFRDSANDGRLRILMWRSPNQPGEYVLLEPGKGCQSLTWDTPEGRIAYPEADNARLPTRTDRQNTNYLGLVDPDSGLVGKGLSYKEAIEAAAQIARENKGVLGKYCNFLLVCKEIGYPLPTLPAPLEDVIDSNVKTGASLRAVSDWIDDKILQMKLEGVAIPADLQDRFILRADPKGPRVPQSPTTTNSFIDKVGRLRDNHIRTLETLRSEIAGQASPPAGVVQMAFENPALFPDARKLNQEYAATLARNMRQLEEAADARARASAQKRSGRDKPPERLLQQFTQRFQEAARKEAYNNAAAAVLRFLAKYPPEQQPQLLAAAWTSAHLPDKSHKARKEGPVWIAGPEKTRGPAHILIEGLQQRGLLAKIRQTGNQLETYDAPDPSSPAFRKLSPVVIRDVWFEFEQHQAERVTRHGQAPYSTMGDVPKSHDRDLKARVAYKAHSDFRNLTLTVRDGHRAHDGAPCKMAYTADGKPFGYIDPLYADTVGESLTLAFSNATDGSLYGLSEREPRETES